MQARPVGTRGTDGEDHQHPLGRGCAWSLRFGTPGAPCEVAGVQAESGDRPAYAPVVRVVHLESQGTHDVGVAHGLGQGRAQCVLGDRGAGVAKVGSVDALFSEHPSQGGA